MSSTSDPWSVLANRLVPRSLMSVKETFLAFTGAEPDEWQERLVNDQAKRILVMCSRQIGKSTTVAVKALRTAQAGPRRTILVGALAQRQSIEFLIKARDVFELTMQDGDGTADDAKTQFSLLNRSRLVALPGSSPGAIRSFSAPDMIIVDEAAFTPDEFFRAVSPMLAVSNGQFILLSSPFAKVGAFYDYWTTAPEWDDNLTAEEQPGAWRRYEVPWWECPRISPDYIEAERMQWGDAYVAREFECKFTDAELSVFRREDIDAAFSGADGNPETWDIF